MTTDYLQPSQPDILEVISNLSSDEVFTPPKVANAVLDGSDAVMLSGETANGSHPVAALQFMGRTCVEAEGITNYSQLFAALRESTLAEIGPMTIPEAVASSSVKTQIDMGAKVCNFAAGVALLL